MQRTTCVAAPAGPDGGVGPGVRAPEAGQPPNVGMGYSRDLGEEGGTQLCPALQLHPPLHFLSGCGDKLLRNGRVSSFCWKGWELQWGVEGKEEKGSLPDQESHLGGLPLSPLGCQGLWWGQRPQHGHLPHPQKEGRELTHAENWPSGH